MIKEYSKDAQKRLEERAKEIHDELNRGLFIRHELYKTEDFPEDLRELYIYKIDEALKSLAKVKREQNPAEVAIARAKLETTVDLVWKTLKLQYNPIGTSFLELDIRTDWDGKLPDETAENQAPTSLNSDSEEDK